MLDELRELWRFRDLLRQLVRRELKVRYKNSVLGFFWSIIPPLLQVIVYKFFAESVANVHTRNYSAYLLCGLIPWTFLTNATLDASQSILVNYSIIKKVYLPREVIPLAIVISNFVHFLLAWGVYFTVFLLLLPHFDVGIPFLKTMAWFPVITLIELLLVTGLSLWVAALNVFYEDVKFILQTLFSLLLFLLPVIYPGDKIYYNSFMRAHPFLYHLYVINPITAVIEAYRKTLLLPFPSQSFKMEGPPLPMNWSVFGQASLITVFVVLSGYWYFNYRKWQFIERP